MSWTVTAFGSGGAPALARRRHSCLGRFRIVAALSLCWNFGKKSRVVRPVG